MLPRLRESEAPARHTDHHSLVCVQGSSVGSSPACYSSMCWHPFSAGVPPLLAVAGSSAAEIWQYHVSLMTWKVSQRLRQ